MADTNSSPGNKKGGSTKKTSTKANKGATKGGERKSSVRNPNEGIRRPNLDRIPKLLKKIEENGSIKKSCELIGLPYQTLCTWRQRSRDPGDTCYDILSGLDRRIESAQRTYMLSNCISDTELQIRVREEKARMLKEGSTVRRKETRTTTRYLDEARTEIDFIDETEIESEVTTPVSLPQLKDVVPERKGGDVDEAIKVLQDLGIIPPGASDEMAEFFEESFLPNIKSVLQRYLSGDKTAIADDPD